MRINLAKSAGFCFGVKRAIDIALETVASRKNVYTLGDIVHNEEVAEQMRKRGLKKAKRLARGKNRTLVVRAHGAGLKLFNKARALGYDIVDATCPMVKEIHKIARNAESKGCAVLVIGDKQHDEVIGIIGQLKRRAIVIDGLKGVPWGKIKKIKKAAAVAQSTQNSRKVMEIINRLKPLIKELKFFNTICRPTRLKQEEIRKMPLENDLMIIIGSRQSANTKRLYEISKSLNRKSYWVQSERDLRPEWFRGIKTVGITAGASTPDAATKEIIARIKEIAAP